MMPLAQVRDAVAPNGVLRAVINLGNPVLASREAVSGRLVGVSVDLACALAAQLQVRLQLLEVETAAQAVLTQRCFRLPGIQPRRCRWRASAA